MKRWMFVSAAGIGLAACSFGALQIVATPAQIGADVVGVAVPRDHSQAWALDADGLFYNLDPATNSLAWQVDLSFIGPVALTGEAGQVDAILMLSDIGIVRWFGSSTEILAAAPIADTLCDITADLDGDIYVSTVSAGSAQIHRLADGAVGFDAPVTIPGASTCLQISADPAGGNVAVLEPGDDSVDLYTDALAYDSTTSLSALLTDAYDVDLFGGHLATVGDDDLGWVIVQYLGLIQLDGTLVDANVINGEVDGQRVHFVDDSSLGTLETWVGGGVAVWQAMVGRYAVNP